MAQRDDRKSSPLAAEGSDKMNYGYQYSALASRSIRLIRILPGEPSAPVRCTVVHRHLEDHPEYDALSYAWGSNAKTHCIHVEPQDPSVPEMTLPVTGNCFRLLQHLRNTSISTGEIWIDAVCINQENNEEKEKQVAMMGEVFKGAERVLVYPGRVHQDSARRMADLRRHIEVWRDESISIPGNVRITMARILEQEWFWRTWVLQEVMLARRPEIILGRETSPWMDFTNAAEKISRLIQMLHRRKTIIPPIVGLAESVDKGDDLKLYDLLKRTQGLKASDSRDKVFALLGIASPNPTYSSLVQYGRTTVGQIYAAFAREFIAESGTLDVLSLSANIQLTYTDQDRCLKATWAPHWNARPLLSYDTSIATKNVFNANAGLPASISEATAETDVTGKIKRPPWTVLAVRGRRLGFVSSSIWELGFDVGIILRHTLNREHLVRCRRACAVARKCSRYPGESAKHICFRTFNFHLPVEQSPMETEKLSKEFWKMIDRCGPANVFEPFEPGFKTFLTNMSHRRVCSTDSGYFGLIPSHCKEGDLVCCLAGGRVPYVLRQSDDGNDFKLVGECYIHGVMQGEALRGAKLEDLEVFQLS